LYKGEKHIAISFLLVFILPIMYQPIHILRHHAHKYNCSFESCHRDDSGHPVFQKNNHCFVCEYEFTVTSLPEEFDIPFVESCVNELNPAKVQDIFSFEVILHTSPRAPPLLF
jgi:hypothetical protein